MCASSVNDLDIMVYCWLTSVSVREGEHHLLFPSHRPIVDARPYLHTTCVDPLLSPSSRKGERCAMDVLASQEHLSRCEGALPCLVSGDSLTSAAQEIASCCNPDNPSSNSSVPSSCHSSICSHSRDLERTVGDGSRFDSAGPLYARRVKPTAGRE